MSAANNWKTIAVVLVLAVLFRSWGTFDLNGYAGDEGIIVGAAKSVMEYGIGDWRNPPLNSFIVAGTISLFGDNPVGWRISGIFFSVMSILLIYLISRQLYPKSNIPILAASLLAFDPFDIHFSRTATMEPAAIFFFLIFLYLIIEYCNNNRYTLTWAGVAMGCAISTKAYYVFAIPVVVMYVFYRSYQRSSGLRALICFEGFFNLLLLPLSIYVLSYFHWFGRGHTFTEFIQFRYDAWWITNNNFKFAFEKILAQGGKPWEWFIKPISFGHHLFSDGEHGRYSIEINNPLFRMMVIPAFCVVIFKAIKTRCMREFLVPLLFASCYLLFFLVNRQVNSYSCLVLLPFAWILLARAVIILAKKYASEQEVTLFFFCAVVISGCYLFPLTSAFLVPNDLYNSVLAITKLTRVF